MNKGFYTIPEIFLEGTFFHGKRCFLKPSRSFKITWTADKKEFIFHAPHSLLNLDHQEGNIYFAYWEYRCRRQKVPSILRKKFLILTDSLRPRRSKKTIQQYYQLNSSGRHHNLEYHYQKVIRELLPRCCEKIQLGWTRKPVKTYWGKYIPDAPAIVLNSILDSGKCPGYMIDYVIYHELLHHILGTDFQESHYRHSPRFRQLMQKFPHERSIRKEMLQKANLFFRNKKVFQA